MQLWVERSITFYQNVSDHQGFGLSGHILRQIVLECLFPGATKIKLITTNASFLLLWSMIIENPFIIAQIRWSGAFNPCLSVSFKRKLQ